MSTSSVRFGLAPAVAWALIAIALAATTAACGGGKGDGNDDPTPEASVATSAGLGQALEVLRREVIEVDAAPDHVIAFRLDAPLPAGTRIAPYLPDPLPDEFAGAACSAGEQVLDQPAWFFWVDDHPDAMFTHGTRYVLIDAAGEQVLAVTPEGWPPCIDGELVSRWTDDEQRARPENQAYARRDRGLSPPAAAASRPNRLDGWLGPPGASVLALPSSGPVPAGTLSFAEEVKPAVVAISGWAPGQTGEGAMISDTARAREVARKRGLPEASTTVRATATGPALDQVRTEIDRVVAGGRANNVLLLITAHGSITAKGESYVVLGGARVRQSDLNRMLATYAEPAPGRGAVTFNVAVAACRSAGFRDMAAPNVARVETCAASVQDLCVFEKYPEPGYRWSKAVLNTLAESQEFTDCVACALSDAARAGAAVPDSSRSDPMFQNPITGDFVRLPWWVPNPAGLQSALGAGADLAPAPSPPTTEPSASSSGGTGTTAAPPPGGAAAPAPAPGAPVAPSSSPSTTAPPAATAATPSDGAGSSDPATSAPVTQTFSGPLSGAGTFSAQSCSWETVITGTMRMTLTFNAGGVSGTASAQGQATDRLLSGDEEECEGDDVPFSGSAPVGGTASAISFTYSEGTQVIRFNGSLIGNAIVGHAAISNAEYAGGGSIPVTLTSN